MPATLAGVPAPELAELLEAPEPGTELATGVGLSILLAATAPSTIAPLDLALIVAVPAGHALAGRDHISLAELAEQPLIMQQQGSGVRHVLMAAFAEEGVRERDLAIDLELGLQQSVKAAVLDGLGISVLSRLAVDREAADGMLSVVPIAGEGLTRDFFSVRPSGRTPKRIASAFLEFARGWFDGGSRP